MRWSPGDRTPLGTVLDGELYARGSKQHTHHRSALALRALRWRDIAGAGVPSELLEAVVVHFDDVHRVIAARGVRAVS
ncbi:MAG: hypothetical protein JO262_08545 [Solirubrobacterales bacterium]|nr:hypothetical protein [Solirubrobacterales bacterium]